MDFCPAELLTTEKERSALMLKLFSVQEREILEAWKQLCIRDVCLDPSSSQGAKNKGSK